jgi:hypothetical protein
MPTTREEWVRSCEKYLDALIGSGPTTGIAGCCALAARGQIAAAPPGSVMNSQSFI